LPWPDGCSLVLAVTIMEGCPPFNCTHQLASPEVSIDVVMLPAACDQQMAAPSYRVCLSPLRSAQAFILLANIRELVISEFHFDWLQVYRLSPLAHPIPAPRTVESRTSQRTSGNCLAELTIALTMCLPANLLGRDDTWSQAVSHVDLCAIRYLITPPLNRRQKEGHTTQSGSIRG
jgi:hypothetical protein